MTPSFLMILLTHNCNLNCKYCYLGNKSTFKDYNITMSEDTLKKSIIRLAENYVLNDDKNEVTIQFAGGEPLLLGHEKIDKYYTIVDTILKQYEVPHKMSLITNGLLIDEKFVNIFIKHNLGVCVSIDGLTNIDRDGSQEQINKIVQNIKLLESKGLNPSFNTVLTKNNIHTATKECDSVINDYFNRSTRILVKDPRSIEDNLTLSAEEKLKYYFIPELERFIHGEIKDLNNFFNIGVGRYLRRWITDRYTNHSDICRTSCGTTYCGGGITVASISPEGIFQTCADSRGDEEFFGSKISNSRDKDFLQLHKLKKNVDMIRTFNQGFEKCDMCLHRYYCEKPCMIYIHKRYGSYDIPEEYCTITKELVKWYEEHTDEIFKVIYDFYPDHKLPITEDVMFQLKASYYRPNGQYNITLCDSNSLDNYFFKKIYITKK